MSRSTHATAARPLARLALSGALGLAAVAILPATRAEATEPTREVVQQALHIGSAARCGTRQPGVRLSKGLHDVKTQPEGGDPRWLTKRRALSR
jgi:hypothetical protein